MLRFFRQIRKKLMEQNKVRAYIYYALGEIMLVMIGILLALQVNNWNETRKIQSERVIFMASIKQDLQADITILRIFLDDVENSYDELKSERARINKLGFDRDSLINYAKNEINIFYYSFDGFNNNTYESLKTSGNLSLINDPIKRELFELSSLQASSSETNTSYTEAYLEKSLLLFSKYPTPVDFAFIQDGTAYDMIWNNVDDKELAQLISMWGTSKANLFRSILRDYTPVLEKTTSILERF